MGLLLLGRDMFGWFAKKPIPAAVEKVSKGGLFSTHRGDLDNTSNRAAMSDKLRKVWNRYLSDNRPRVMRADGTMDDADSGTDDFAGAFDIGQPAMSDALFQWYGTQSFIGHQACAIIAQHWLIDKICSIPARDAIRQGYEVTSAVGETELSEDELAEYAKYDKLFTINQKMYEYARLGRIFGIRVCIPVVESGDVDYYEKPFNPDGVTAGSYKGMIQVDPYWMSPILSGDAASRPDVAGFYEPTWWLINGKKYHRSHLCIFRTGEVPDILKPSYLYSGVPIPQKIMERVYAAERTGNEAPLLALTKRLMTYKIDDLAAVMANKAKFDQGMQFAIETRDNHGFRIMGKDDEMDQIDTSLADLADVIENQYALACAAGEVPVNKAMGTAVGGLSNEGSYDESNYHEGLESLQTHELSPMLERHHLLVRLSFVVPKFGKGTPGTVVSWLPLDSPTAKEYSEINLNNANADVALKGTGAIDDTDINARLRNDKNSGYTTLAPLLVSGELLPDDDDVTPNNSAPADKGTESPENLSSAKSSGQSVSESA